MIPPADKPLDVLREESIDKLIVNYGGGRLSLEAFENRLDRALAAQRQEELMDLVEDLELPVSASYLEQKRRELEAAGIPTGGSRPGEDEGRLRLRNVMSSNQRCGDWEVPGRIRLDNVLGDFKLDFTEAQFSTDTVYIEILSILADTKLIIREGIRVRNEVNNVLGDLKVKVPATAGATGPLLVLEGSNILGEISCKPRKEKKEFWLQIAQAWRGPQT